ncbi:TIGR01777 family oxidoreductase [Chondromyces apiculatus]|uniref:Cell division inhibitor n=1 Tax=Chondromyces apiculatus DSM 436 TaxID=1192034 RepID=A0A017SW34_9BACT|nr:TIGR01777 family oxidoreductase [Chondromyces apiculatus]EYF01193.1 Cell division inhibitor [Chondromyces apiculatus DSM 436]
MKKILITGGTGFIGRALIKELLSRGDEVIVFSRDVARAQRALPGTRAVAWDPDQAGPWFEAIDGVDSLVHLAGEPIAKRWNEAARRDIIRSRVETTRLLGDAIARAKKKPTSFICASAIGYYGPQPPEKVFDEDAPAGEGFLADVVVRWEEAAQVLAAQQGVRSVQLRIGIVVGEGGGALEKMITPFRLFAGGPIGDGRQMISWIHVDDVVGLTLLAMENESVQGPFNVVAPNPVNGEELAKAIGQVLGRPSWLRVPEAVVRLGLGDAAEIITTGQNVHPKRALELGYKFHYTDVVTALESTLR